MSKINLKKQRAKNRKQANAIAVRTAHKNGGYAFIEKGGKKGIFRVTGKSWRKKKLTLLHNLSNNAVYYKSTKWFTETVKNVRRRAPTIYARQLRKQIEFRLARMR